MNQRLYERLFWCRIKFALLACPWLIVPCPASRPHWRWQKACFCEFERKQVLFFRAPNRPGFKACWASFHADLNDDGRVVVVGANVDTDALMEPTS